MSALRIAAAAAALVAVAGCAVPPPASAPAISPEVAAAEGVTVSKLQDGRFLGLVGPRKQHARPFLNVADTNYYCLRSFIDPRNGDAVHQLYVQYSYLGGPYKWNAAHDQNDEKLRFAALNHNEISCEFGCSYADEFAASLPEPLLRRSREAGLKVTFTGADKASKTIDVDPGLIDKEIGAVDAVRANLKMTAEKPAPETKAAAAEPAVAPSPAAATPAPAAAAQGEHP